MKLDRILQREVLAKLCDTYPDDFDGPELFRAFTHIEPGTFYANLIYLNQHGLIDLSAGQYYDGERYVISASATNQGMDFMADDGGLSAILGVVTIKLHDDTIKLLIESKILQSNLPEPDKKRFLDQLRELPAETTKHLVLKLVDLGLEKGPEAIATIGRLLSRVPGLG